MVQELLEILKYILPALVVLAATYMIINKFLTPADGENAMPATALRRVHRAEVCRRRATPAMSCAQLCLCYQLSE